MSKIINGEVVSDGTPVPSNFINLVKSYKTKTLEEKIEQLEKDLKDLQNRVQSIELLNNI